LTAASDEQLLAVARAALRLADVAARRLMGSCSPRWARFRSSMLERHRARVWAPHLERARRVRSPHL